MSAPTVLVIEDDAASREIAAYRLTRLGCRVLKAPTGSKGLALVAERPDLVLLDLCLPGIDGEAVLARLRETPATAALPVIVVTAQSDRQRVMRIARHGVTGYLVKPFDPNQFDTLVEQTLRERAAATQQATVLLGTADESLAAAVAAAVAPAATLVRAGSGEEILDRADEVAPCAVLVDAYLSGLTAVDTIRLLGLFKSRSALTAALAPADTPARQALGQAGFDVIIDTPIPAARLLAEVAAAGGLPVAPLLSQILARHGECVVFPATHCRWPALAEGADALAAAVRGRTVVVDATHVTEPGLALLDLLDLLAALADEPGALALAAPPETAALLASVRETRRVPSAPTVAEVAATAPLRTGRGPCS
jgi:CheY-like chemotaxis protein